MCTFLSSTLGVSVYKHYCGNYLADISIWVKSNPCADESGADSCSAEKEMSCCEDETEYFQLDTKLAKQETEQLLFGQTFVIVYLIKKNTLTTYNALEVEEFCSESPPNSSNDLYQKYERLVFYG